MREKRITAILMSLFMVISLLPATVFAAAPTTLEGQLKIKGAAAAGTTLSADLKEVKPEGLSEDSISCVWSRKAADDEKEEHLKELSKEKTYTVTKEDIGSKIVLKVTGLEGQGYTGTLKAVTGEVTAEADTSAENASEDDGSSQEQSIGDPSGQTGADTQEGQDTGDSAGQTDENVQEDQNTGEGADQNNSEPAEDVNADQDNGEAGSDPVEGIPAATEDNAENTGTEDEGTADEPYQNTEDSQPAEDNQDTAGTEQDTTETEDTSGDNAGEAGSEAMDGIPAAKEDGTTQSGAADSEDQNTEAKAQAETADGSDVIDFGTVSSDAEDDSLKQYVTVTNTGSETLNFDGNSPEHFAVQDITEPLEPGQSVDVWVVPRVGTEPGTYDDTITYTSEEGANASYTAKMVLTEEKAQEQPSEDQSQENPDKTGEEQTGAQVTPGSEDQTDEDNNAPAESALTTDQTVLPEFTAADQSAKVTIKNTSAEALTVNVKNANGNVVVEPTADSTIAANGSAEYTVKPSQNAKTGEKLTDTITFTDTANAANTVSVTATVNLPEKETVKQSKVTADAAEAVFDNLTEGYTELPAPKTITFTNSGAAEAVLTVTSDKAEGERAFDAVMTNEKVPAENGTAMLNIQPKAGLKAGTYTETFTVTDTAENAESQPVTIKASITIDAVNHSLTIDKGSLSFASVKEGYGQIQAGQITVTNNGNTTETLTQPAGTNFDVSKVDASALTVKPGETVSFTVAPKTGLKVGDYNETIKITAQSGAEISFTASFQVIKGTASVTKIQAPAAVTGIANGTKKDAKSLNLPSSVVIETTKGNMNAAVKWDVENAAYDPSSTKEQTFTVKGSVSLPDGVDNNNKIDLSTSVKVTVKGYSPKLASADNNYITGIKYNGVYTTQSKISFTAVGAGMDNDSPKNGDTRYVPMKWTVINTNIWNSAPYTASFGLAQSGDYTLQVIFRQQAYDGSMWRNQDSYDTKTVPFSISKAKVTAPGQNLTPAANRRRAVKTGDNTMIAPFVILLAAAAGAIGGVIVYRRKRNK